MEMRPESSDVLSPGVQCGSRSHLKSTSLPVPVPVFSLFDEYREPFLKFWPQE